MGGLADFRAKNPAYDDMSDGALADALHRKFYADMPRQQFDAKMGLVPEGSNLDASQTEALRRAKERVATGERPEADPVQHPEFEATPRYGGTAMNATAGGNEAIYGTLGLPVDAMRGAMNLGIRGVNAATGADIGTIPENSFGGLRFIAESLGAIRPELDPQNTVATSTEERIARGVGQGVTGTVLPAGLVGAASRAGVIGAKAAETGAQLFGRSSSIRNVAADAVVGAASGAGAATAAEFTPEQYRAIGNLAGGLVSGGVGTLAMSLPRLAMDGARAAGRALEPFTPSGREQMAGRRLVGAATAPRAAIDAIADAPRQLVPGSAPTTGQVTGDMGLLGLERASQTKYPEAFQQRRADQNAARVGSLESIQPKGAAEAVTKAIRSHLGAIDDETQRAFLTAQEAARRAAQTLGPGQSPSEAGSTIRADYEAARAGAKTQESALWNAVDPDGTMALSPAEVRKHTAETLKTLPRSAKPPEGEEAAIYEAVRGFGEVIPFAEMTTLRTRVNDALRAERRANGESQVYRRLAMTRSSIERDLERVVSGRAMSDEFDVRQGRKRPEETLAARIEAVQAPSVGDAVFTAGGRRVGVRYELAEGDSLVTSNTPDGRANTAYPAGLQPRDRSRAASDAQIAGIARNLQPERLGASTSPAEGAPIVGPDGVVESGNGRTLGIRQAYREKGPGAQAYRDYLQSQGYDTTGFREPVLVRRRVSDMPPEERVRFAQEANASSSLTMSASEQAASDASRINSDLLTLYRGGDLASAENRDFTRAFLRTVPDKGQEGSFVTGDGALSLDGTRRMQNALLHSAYRDTPLVASLAEEGDENIRSFGRALTDLSGDVARLRAGVDAGRVDPSADISRSLVEAARVVQGARSRNVRLADAVAQQDAFSQVSPGALGVLKLAYGDTLSGRLSREKLGGIMRSVLSDAEQQTADARLFGGALDAATILEGARVRYGNATVSAGRSVASPRNDGASGAGIRPREGGPGDVPARQADAAGVGSYEGESVLARPELTANFDGAALGRLKAASSATKRRAETFDNKTLAPIRKRGMASGPYNKLDAEVPALIFSGQPKSFEAVGAYRKAVGDQAAMDALQPYAVDQLRRAALKDDGTFDPGRLARWRQSHQDVLRAFPDLDARFADAGRAAETMGDVAATRRQRMDEAQKSVFGSFIGIEDPDEVVKRVGALIGRADGPRQIFAIRSAIRADKEAQQGLRKAAADYIAGRFVGNTEAGTSGVGTVKSDGFQTYVKQNRTALRSIFTEEEVKSMEAIAADLQRSNRSLNAVRIPGQSNTMQDKLAGERGGTATSMLAKIIGPAAAAGGGAGIATNSFSGMAVGAGTLFVAALRENGIRRADELVRDALLHPDRAKALMLKIPPNSPAYEAAAAKRYRASVLATTGIALGAEAEERQKRTAGNGR